MNSSQSSSLENLFLKYFGDAPGAVTIIAPGRVNLIGEHVDYNDGFVLPMAISLATTLRIRPRGDNVVDLYAANLDRRAQFSLDAIEPRHGEDRWLDYVQGVADQLQKSGHALRGFEGVIESTVPAASGLSSSAALEVGACLAFLHASGQSMAPADIALLCQRAENQFVGVNCGIMDQMAVAACQANNALLLDCRSLDMEQVPFDIGDYVLVVTDSDAPRELAASAYNERRAQCEAGLSALQEVLPDVQSLRDVSPAQLDQFGARLDPVVLQRVRHVVSEIARTQQAVAALRAGDLKQFGACMNASHASLRDDYEVSSLELDWLAAWCQNHRGVLGSRMTGAGFGGCIVTLVAREQADALIAELPPKYFEATGRQARCWICRPEAGAHIL